MPKTANLAIWNGSNRRKRKKTGKRNKNISIYFPMPLTTNEYELDLVKLEASTNAKDLLLQLEKNTTLC